MDIETYMTDRVDDQLKYYENAATRAKNTHVRTQAAIIILGLLVPVVTNLPSSWGPSIDIGPQIKIAVTILSLTLAILTGLANFRKPGDLWLTYRMTEELLKHEKFLFITGSGPYFNSEKAGHDFVESIESIISAEHNKFRTIVDTTRRATDGRVEAGQKTEGESPDR
ncbi:hypothetical protein DSCA_26150 [Desulfosarcina alkanivorans]|jgi:hypothetical protein|uniref:DUF4231 domain-containing protein n=1 Tax=Desulfosarcina alkanivorans TaxID=571177 RepID=A0A5K7YJY1_9BACT|nr:DUF4231 domain-containing protein [Desulfosarcina alkanivorans]BBO68685.1 hypothetical protein DSCA_26150 [Desulfosarcina alkanivorans]